MVKTILQMYPIQGSEEELRSQAPYGLNTDGYQKMLAQLTRLSQRADALGYWGITHVEHHFHSEGFEMSPDPGILNLYLGMQTKNIRMGQLGYVISTRDPIRLAEQTAMIDNMLKGRFFVGLARGYQRRWTNVLGQKYGVIGTYSDQSEIDQRNRDVFEDHFHLMKKAWTEAPIDWTSDEYQIPIPPEGTDWPVADATKIFGAPGELDDQDRSVKISVVPRPYQKPHPPLFQAFSVSPRTMEWCAEQDITPTVLPGPLSLVGELAEVYAKACRENGRNYEIGEHNALVREIYICEEDEIEEYIEKYDRLIWEQWFRGFGFYEAFRLPGEEGPIPAPGESLAQRMIKSDYLIAGPIEKVKARVKEIHDRFNFEYWVLLFHQGLMPEELANKQMDLIAEVLNDL